MTQRPRASVNPEFVVTVNELEISEQHNRQVLVRDVSFGLRRGQVLGIAGESGSGKTLTCRALLGLLPKPCEVTRGTIALHGRDIARFSRAEWDAARGGIISAVFQDPGSYLNPSIAVGKQVAEIFRVKRRLSARAAQAEVLRRFEALQLDDAARIYRQYPHELSGGMLQRVLIASAIALDPDVLIADEATTALDATVQADLLDLLRDLNQRLGLSLIVVSHDLAVIAQLCDEVLIMRSGRIVERGRVEALLYKPQHEYTRLLVSEYNAYSLPRREPALPEMRLPHVS